MTDGSRRRLEQTGEAVTTRGGRNVSMMTRLPTLNLTLLLAVGLLAVACKELCPPAPTTTTPHYWVLWGYIPNRYQPFKAYSDQYTCERDMRELWVEKNPAWSFVCLPETVSPYGR
jgi:hypothetical protein